MQQPEFRKLLEQLPRCGDKHCQDQSRTLVFTGSLEQEDSFPQQKTMEPKES